eukprot:15077646-Heterocapsa_arctica.AAC.1
MVFPGTGFANWFTYVTAAGDLIGGSVGKLCRPRKEVRSLWTQDIIICLEKEQVASLKIAKAQGDICRLSGFWTKEVAHLPKSFFIVP